MKLTPVQKKLVRKLKAARRKLGIKTEYLDRVYARQIEVLNTRKQKLDKAYDANNRAANTEYHTAQMSAIKAGLPIAVTTDVMNY